MLKVDSSLNHIPAGRNHVIGLHESINQPLVNIPSFGTAPTGAFVMGTRNDQGAYTVFVYLYQVETRAVVVYVSEPRHLTHEQYRAEEAEALRFVESMGFMVDNLHFPTLAPPEQEALMERIPLFRPPQATLDLYDVQEESGPRGPAPAPIFGGLSPSDSALLRQANHPTNPGVLHVGRPPVLGTPLSPGPAPLRRPAIDPAVNPTANPAVNAMGNPAASVAASEAETMTPGGYGSALPGPATVQTAPLTQAPVPAAPKPEPDPQALKRLGRLLGTFVLLACVMLVFAACKSGSTSGGTGQQPDSVTAYIDLGTQQLAQAQWAEAIKAFSEVLDVEDDNFDALRGTALAYLNLGRLDDAERFYQRSLESNPKSSLSRNELAVVYLEQRRCEEAVPLFEKVLEDIFYATPEFAEHNLAQAYACLGRTDEAISRLDKLVTKRPYFCLGYLTLSRLASSSRRPDVTVQACEDFVHHCEEHEKIREQVLPQQSALCYYRKGLAYAEMGDVESARTAFERCQLIRANTPSGVNRAPVEDVGRECQESLRLLPR